jgi:phage-related tail protein
MSVADSAALRRIERKLDLLLPQVRKLIAMSENIDTELAAETAEETALATAVTANTAALTQVRADLAAALEAAKTAGLTPEQVAAFQAIHDKVAADIAAINTADAPPAA